MTSLGSIVGRAARYLRGRQAGWNAQSDRAFHDGIFAGQDHDPFDPAYPGHITIRRFADLASERVKDETAVFDLGCGPGEISCELASRFPGIAFHGLDHSAVAIERARQLADARGLRNITFARVDIDRTPVDKSAGLIAMFDAFHHMVNPERFVALNAHVARWFLIEPAGDVLGRWRYRYDFDWVLLELDKLRWRFEHELGVPPPQSPGSREATTLDGGAEAVEFRYSLDDYERFFAGYGVRATGTTCGITTYPPGPGTSASRRAFNIFAYQLLCDADARLLADGDDLDARHWAIYCARGERSSGRRPKGGRAIPPGEPLQGPYGAMYELVRGPAQMAVGTTADFVVRVSNSGFLAWSSDDSPAFHMSYHWRDATGRIAVADGRRTRLAAPVTPGQSIATNVVVAAPDIPGDYTLEVELVHEGVAWLSHAGQPALALDLRVR